MARLFSTITKTSPIVDASGKMKTEFISYLSEREDRTMIVGSGNPEGAQEARQGTFYLDTTGTSGNVVYVKQLNEISGDRSQGWILV